ncbi:MAG: DUF951 domain-containing protein [Clostridia bacterium]|nr:DUF951 domain-containing protein [Clostridia bacterium]
MPIELNLNDIVELKKPHPCGDKRWKILRTGADFRIQCLGCGHKVMLSRVDLEKRIKKILKGEENESK